MWSYAKARKSGVRKEVFERYKELGVLDTNSDNVDEWLSKYPFKRGIFYVDGERLSPLLDSVKL